MREHDPAEIPPQTITMSSDRLGREMADRLAKGVERFTVYRSGPDVHLRCHGCNQIVMRTHTSALIHFVDAALEHECEPRSSTNASRPMANRTVRTCEAVTVTLEHEWQPCEEPIAAIGAYTCRCDHLAVRASCAGHDPAKLAADEVVGCRQCKDEGHDCEMAWMTLPVSAELA